MRARAGRNSAATASVEPAIARSDSSVSGLERELEQEHEAEVGGGSVAVSAP